MRRHFGRKIGMKYTQALEYIESLQHFGIRPGLDSIARLCERLGNPQDSLRFVHIAGTNGKGSVLAFLSTVLQCAGYRVGRYLSPALRDCREKIQVNGRPISQKALCGYVERIREICREMEEEGVPHPTPFEVETAMAFCFFRDQGCQIAVLETGMGGRLDATNVIRNTLLAVITSVSMDHSQYLGDTLEKIAGEKAGILKPGCRAVTAPQREPVLEVIREKAAREGVPVALTDLGQVKRVRRGLERQRFDFGELKDLEISLAGCYQIENAAVALTAVRELGKIGFPVPEKALRRGLAETAWPGRFTVLARKPCFVADGAHNEDGARKLAQSIEFYFTNRRIIYIMGILRDKEYDKIIRLTCPYADQIITVAAPGNPRAMSSYELAREAARVHPRVTAAASLEEAVEMSYLLADREDVIVAFGSLSFLGRVMELVKEREKNRERRRTKL